MDNNIIMSIVLAVFGLVIIGASIMVPAGWPLIVLGGLVTLASVLNLFINCKKKVK